MTEEETKAWMISASIADLKSFIFVTRETHLKIVCTCPECGTTFFSWLHGGYEMDIETIKMEMATTDCTYCAENEEEAS